MFKNKQFEDLKKVFKLFILYSDNLDEKNKESNDDKKEKKDYFFINKVLKVLFVNFENYIIERGNYISNNKEISKDPKLFIPELIKLYKEMNNLTLNIFICKR